MRTVLITLAATVALTACGPKMIPGTEIRDTDETRALIDVIGAYRTALEAKNPDKILSLVSPTFFETSGTPEGGDDYDYNGLKEKLRLWANRTKAVRADIKVKAITVSDDGKSATATYFYDLNYQVPVEGAVMWKRDSDTKQMSFKKESGAWKIASGI